MPYGKGQPKEEAVLDLGVGNHIIVRWLNTTFHFPPEGGLLIGGAGGLALFAGDELAFWQRLGVSAQGAAQSKGRGQL